MTREKQIKQAALERNYDGDFDSNNGLNGFVEGAQWADEHPKNPWRDAKKELPLKENHKDGLWGQEVLARTQSGNYYRMRVRENGEWQNLVLNEQSWWLYTGKVTHWMPIPDLPKGGDYGL